MKKYPDIDLKMSEVGANIVQTQVNSGSIDRSEEHTSEVGANIVQTQINIRIFLHKTIQQMAEINGRCH